MQSSIVETREEKRATLELMYSHGTAEMQQFRSAAAKIGLGFSGVFLVTLGWVINRDTPLTVLQQTMYTVLLAAFVSYSMYITRIMHQYFLQLAQLIHRIDVLLGMFEVGKYVDDDALFPNTWRAFGDFTWKEPVFRAAYLGMGLLGGLGAVIIWMA